MADSYYNLNLNKAYLMCIIASLYLKTLDSTSILPMGAILNSEITQKKHKNVKNITLNRLQEGHLFIEGRGLPSWTSAGNNHIM